MDERGRSREQGEIVLAFTFVAIAALGVWLRAPLLTLFGVLGALTSSVLYLWQRTCLFRTELTRHLGNRRFHFGDTIQIDYKLMNDKVLPLPWIRLTDQIPSGLHLTRDKVAFASTALDQAFQPVIQNLSLLPFEVFHRSIEITADRRGRHLFGAAELVSGDPLGIRPRSKIIDLTAELLVYPKISELVVPPLLSRTIIGARHPRRQLLTDPYRPAGSRPYQPRDPLRNIDWRATARTAELLVRDFDSSDAPNLTIFVDCRLAPFEDVHDARSSGEFAISLAASLVLWAARRKVPTNLFSNGLLNTMPLQGAKRQRSASATEMLETLALLEIADRPFHECLMKGIRTLKSTTTVVVISSSFTPRVLQACDSCRKKATVATIEVTGLHGDVADLKGLRRRGGGDVQLFAVYRPTWLEEESIALT